ncbi:hypothetical protein ACFQYP_49355 [Nonomuraea antimicrobica]
MHWPTDRPNMTSEPPPAKASSPRLDIVAGAGSVGTRPSGSGGSGRVSATEVRR